MMEREIAKVEHAELGLEDHDIFGFNIAFAGAGWGQGTGWYALSTSKGGATSCAFLERIVRSFGVRDWSKIVGRTVWVEHTHAKLTAWENLPTEPGFRFVIADELARLLPQDAA